MNRYILDKHYFLKKKLSFVHFPTFYRVFYNALREIKLKYFQQGLLIGLKIGYVHVPQVGGFVFLPLE